MHESILTINQKISEEIVITDLQTCARGLIYFALLLQLFL